MRSIQLLTACIMVMSTAAGYKRHFQSPRFWEVTGSIPFDLITRMAAGSFRNLRHSSVAMGAEPTDFATRPRITILP
jgi:hypothetical protein